MKKLSFDFIFFALSGILLFFRVFAPVRNRGWGSVLLKKKLGKNLEGIGFIRIFATTKVK